MIGTPSAATYLPTDERRLPSGADADQDLFALYTQYGRYQDRAFEPTRTMELGGRSELGQVSQTFPFIPPPNVKLPLASTR